MSDTDGLRARIAEELNRGPAEILSTSFTPTLTVGRIINREINAAIGHYESVRFRWNETREDSSTVTANGTRTYSLPANLLRLDTVKIVYSGAAVPLDRVSWAWLEETDRDDPASPVAIGIPTKYAVYGNVFRPYPVPNAAMTLYMSYLFRVRPTSLTGSYCQLVVMGGSSLTATSTASHNNQVNGWTTDGQDLIVERAKQAVKINYFKDEDALLERAAIAQAKEAFLSFGERAAYQSLIDETADWGTTGTTKPYCI